MFDIDDVVNILKESSEISNYVQNDNILNLSLFYYMKKSILVTRLFINVSSFKSSERSNISKIENLTKTVSHL